MNKAVKLIILAAIIIVVGFVAYVANGFFGNPISYMLAKNAAEDYIAHQYPDTDFYVDKVVYNFKIGGYYATVLSKTSIDTRFQVTIDMLGNARGDSYDYVASGFNTWQRLSGEYRAMVDGVFEDPDFGLTSNIEFGDIQIREKSGDRPGADFGIELESLEIDGIYDIRELGAKAGNIVLYVQDESATFDRAAEILLYVRKRFDKAEVPFYAVDFVMQSGEKPATNDINVSGFLYQDITEDNLARRIEIAHNELERWYAEQDAKKP